MLDVKYFYEKKTVKSRRRVTTIIVSVPNLFQNFEGVFFRIFEKYALKER